MENGYIERVQYSAKKMWLKCESVTVMQIICYSFVMRVSLLFLMLFLTLMLIWLLYAYTKLFKRDMLWFLDWFLICIYFFLW